MLGRIARWVSAVGISCGLAACSAGAPTTDAVSVKTVRTTKGTFTLPSPALADGAGLEGRRVNVWTSPDRSTLSCTVPDGEPLVLETVRHHEKEDRYYFELTAMSGCKGWLPEAFIKPDPDVRR